MSRILYPFMVLAACGFGLSFAAHCLALAGIPIAGGQRVFALHIGVFFVWLPAVLVCSRDMRFAGGKNVWKVALAGCPLWMRRGVYGLFGYAFLNFFLFFATTASQPQKQRHTGNPPPSVIRGFSGHWMLFYGAAFAILYSRIYAPELYRERKCPQGHSVAPTARFCSECGYDFSAGANKT